MKTGASSPSYGDGVLGHTEGKRLCKRLSARRGVESGLANLLAAVFVYLYLDFLAPDEPRGARESNRTWLSRSIVAW